METTLNYLDAGRTLIGNKASIIGTIGIDLDIANFKYVQFASVKGKVYDAGVHAHFFVFGDTPDINLGEPLRCNFGEAGDAIIFALKQTGIRFHELPLWNHNREPSGMVTTQQAR